MTLTTEELQGVLEKATKGPWGVNSGVDVWIKAGPVHVATIPRAFDGDWSPSNARIIAAAPDLAKDRIRLEAENAALCAEVEKLRKIATQALAVIEDVQTYEQPDDPTEENALTMGEMVVFDFDVQAARAALGEGGE